MPIAFAGYVFILLGSTALYSSVQNKSAIAVMWNAVIDLTNGKSPKKPEDLATIFGDQGAPSPFDPGNDGSKFPISVPGMSIDEIEFIRSIWNQHPDLRAKLRGKPVTEYAAIVREYLLSNGITRENPGGTKTAGWIV